MSDSTKSALAVVAVIVLAVAFWIVLLSPKRDESAKLGEEVTQIQSEVSSEQARAESSLAAKEGYPRNYAELVGLGKAVPAEAATPSLLVQLNGLSERSRTDFKGISGGSGSTAEGGEEGEAVAAEGASELPPLGAGAGPAGLLSMPYQLDFEGSFFDLADFIHAVDSQVETKDGKISANGRLMTIDSFSLSPGEGGGSSSEGGAATSGLSATISVTTYVTPPGQGLTGGATAGGPTEEATAKAP